MGELFVDLMIWFTVGTAIAATCVRTVIYVSQILRHRRESRSRENG